LPLFEEEKSGQNKSEQKQSVVRKVTSAYKIKDDKGQRRADDEAKQKKEDRSISLHCEAEPPKIE
jgi:hypothetical protein